MNVDGVTGVLPYDPWADLATRTGVEIAWHTGRVSQWEKPCGVTNFGNLSITLLAGMDEASLRCTLAHELVHLERGPVGMPYAKKTAGAEERAVHLIASKRLVDPEDYARWLRERTGEHGTQDEARLFCRVDRGTIRAYHGWRTRVTDATAAKAWAGSKAIKPEWPPRWLVEGAEEHDLLVAARFAGADAGAR